MNLNLTRGIQVALFNLLIVGIIGCFLRYFLLHPVNGINYGYVLHAHSHLAFLGWVFTALYVLIVYAYLPSDSLKGGKFNTLFILLQVANIGMLFTFPFMGYALWSIVFSTGHALAAMAFAWLLIRNRRNKPYTSHVISFKWIQWALILMVISNLAPFALGPVSAMQGKSDLYYLLIYFYLHFQYNGWFTFALIGLILWWLERQGVDTNIRLVNIGFKLKLVAVFPAYILSALWTGPDLTWFVIGGFSALLQAAGVVCIGSFLINNRDALGINNSFILRILFWTGLLSLVLQHVLMLLSAIPSLASLAFTRQIVIAYLHMVLLGFVSIWIFFLLVRLKMVRLTLSSKVGFLFLLIAFFMTEWVLVFQGYVIASTNYLFYLALMQLGGILCISIQAKRIKLKS